MGATLAEPTASRRKPFAGRRKRVLSAIAVVATIVAVAVLTREPQRAEERAIARMDPDARRALFEDSRRTAEAVCTQAAGEPALGDRCHAAAKFLAAFPECDAACLDFVRSHRPEATR